MRKNLIISGLCLLCLLFANCTDPFAKEEFVAYDEQPIGLYLETVPEYTDWVKLLKKADLFNAVNISIKYTCFVANNEAVTRYLQQKNPNWRSVDDLTEDEAANLMKYHIIPGADYAFSSLMGKVGTKTISGDYLTATMNDDGSRRFINEVEIVSKDQKLTNGYVHELENVLDPIIYTVMEVLEQTPEYSLMTQAVKECGLDAYLHQKEITVNNVKLRDYKTIIVPSDAVFNAAGVHTIDDLKNMFSGEPTDVKSDFYRYVGYHIFNQALDFSDLTDFALGSNGLNIETYIEREFITVEQNGDDIFINPGEDSTRFVPSKYDIAGNNGYIHEVTTLMPIADPARYPFAWEPTEWDECRALEIYRTPKVKNVDEKEYVFFKKDEVTHFRWKTIPDREEAVGYMSYDVDWDRFLYDDCIYAQLNEVGWLEFDTPTLMRGKYNIQVVKWAWFQNPGKWQMYIDEVKFGPVLDMGNTSQGTLNMGTFRFEDSGPHVFRFSVVGVGANKTAEFFVDRFIFTPEN